MQVLHDPRVYTHDYPESNIIINQAVDIVNRKANEQSLIDILETFLKNKNDAIINVALNLAPSLEVTQIIWRCLQVAINGNNELAIAEIFTIPLVVVVGSKNKVKLPNIINVDELNEFLSSNGIFKAQSDAFISGKLIESSSIQSITASQQYYLAQNIKNAKLWLPLELAYNEIEALNEGVFLRFLVGVAIKDNNTSVIDNIQFKKHSMGLMQLINKNLETSGVTIFPIPFPITSLTDSLIVGNFKRTEIAIQVAFSNIVRKIREAGQNPIAYISTVHDAVCLEVVSEDNSELKEISLWTLNRIDEVEIIHQTIVDLLIDAQVIYEYK